MFTLTCERALNILKILGSGAILSKNGSITICYFLNNPSCYSLAENQFEARNKEYFKAFKRMGSNTYIHKQDVFIRKGFDSSIIKGDSFLQKAERTFFDNKTYIDHYCILSFTIDGLKSLNSAYQSNPLKYDDSLTEYDKKRLSGFLEDVKSVVTIIDNIPDTSLVRMEENDIKSFFRLSLNGFYENGFRDTIFDKNFQIGEKSGTMFGICDSDYLPDTLHSCVKDDSLPYSNTSLYAGMLERMGVHLKATHIVNQMWQFSNEYKSDLNIVVKTFGQHRQFDKEIELGFERLSQLQKEVVDEGNVICKTHFNICILEDGDILDKAIDYVSGVFKIYDFDYYVPSYNGLMQMYLGSIVGNVNKLNQNFWYKTDLLSSLCLMLNFTTFKNDDKGIFFTERLYNTPLRLDIWNKPLGFKIPARNGIIFASTGGGKSVTANHIVQQFIEDGVKQILVEFGSSFYQLTQLYPEISLHVDYDGTTPLGINPFDLGGRELTKEKALTLVNIILMFWKSKDVRNNEEQIVSIRNILHDYYANVKSEHSFPDFYEYVTTRYDDIVERLNISSKYFDIESFAHICKEFIPGGFYENVCKASELGSQINEKDFVVFELTKIKKDPFLINVVSSILLDVIETKLLDRSVKGMLWFDEYAETNTIKNLDNDINLHATVAFCYQKLRKENSGVMTILQAPSQLPPDQYSKGIIANTQILIVLPTTETVYNDIARVFEMNVESHINLMKSLHYKFEGEEQYSEIFFRFLDRKVIAVRLQLSREKFYAFQTDGDLWQSIQNEAKVKGLECTIINQVNEENNEKLKTSISI